MRFEWDEKKNKLNQKKHGVSFDAATWVLHDPMALSKLDERYLDGRWFSIGRAGAKILYVAHLVLEDDNHEETIRIISARDATARERARYQGHP